MTTFDTLLREREYGGNELSNVGSFVLRLREGLPSFNKDKSPIVSGEPKVQRSFLWCLFLENTRKNREINK